MIVITNLYLSKLYGALRLLSDLLDKGWKLGSINSLLKRIHRTGTIVRNQATVGRVRHIAVDDLVLSPEDKPKRHRSAREISHETTILHSSVHRIIHHDLKLKSSNASNDTVLSCCLKPSLVSLADKQPYRLQ